MIVTNKYQRVICEVADMFDAAGIPCTVHPISDGAQVRFPWHEGDIACYHGTLGADDGLVESYRFPWNDGYVTKMMPEEAAARVIELYAQYKEGISSVATEEDLLGLLELS